MNLRLLPLAALPLLALVACDDPKPTSSTTAAASVRHAAVTYGGPTGYAFDTSHSTVGFSVKHMVVSDVKGSFQKFTGELFLDEKDPSKTTLTVEVDTSTIDTRNAERDAHLKSPDFFDSNKFPKMSFKSTKVERSGAGYEVTGDLTIKGVTKAVVLDVDAVAPEIKDTSSGGLHRRAHATTKINRQDFGMKWNKATEMGGAVIGDEVSIDLDVDLVAVGLSERFP